MSRVARVLSLSLFMSLLTVPAELLAFENSSERDDGPIFDTEGPFDMNQLPDGAIVTIPSPATTIVPYSRPYRVGPTDRSQVFRIVASNCAFKVEVFDKTNEGQGVKVSTLKAGESMIYRFERLNGVRVEATPLSKCNQMASLVMDSNRPLEIGI